MAASPHLHAWGELSTATGRESMLFGQVANVHWRNEIALFKLAHYLRAPILAAHSGNGPHRGVHIVQMIELFDLGASHFGYPDPSQQNEAQGLANAGRIWRVANPSPEQFYLLIV
jgi:hypothetical protein